MFKVNTIKSALHHFLMKCDPNAGVEDNIIDINRILRNEYVHGSIKTPRGLNSNVNTLDILKQGVFIERDRRPTSLERSSFGIIPIFFDKTPICEINLDNEVFHSRYTGGLTVSYTYNIFYSWFFYLFIFQIRGSENFQRMTFESKIQLILLVKRNLPIDFPHFKILSLPSVLTSRSSFNFWSLIKMPPLSNSLIIRLNLSSFLGV